MESPWRAGNTLFCETAIMEMLEAPAYKALNKMSSSVRATNGRLGRLGWVLITRTFTLYVEFLRFCTFGRMKPRRSECELQTVPKDIEDFKIHNCRAFGNFQLPGMGTVKYHFLQHHTGDLWLVRSIEYILAGLFHATHKSFKRVSG